MPVDWVRFLILLSLFLYDTFFTPGAGVPYMVCVGATNSAGSGGKWCAVLFTKELGISSVIILQNTLFT